MASIEIWKSFIAEIVDVRSDQEMNRRASIQGKVQRKVLLLGFLFLHSAAAQQAIVINEVAIREHSVSGQPPFVELFCPTPLVCRQDFVNPWIVVLQGDADSNPGWISTFQPYAHRDSTFGNFVLELRDLPDDVGGSPTVLLAVPDHDASLPPREYVVRWRDSTATGYAFGLATTGPRRIGRVSAYEVIFGDTTLSTSIVSNLDVPFKVNNITEKTQIDTFVPDINGNGEWDLEEQIIFVEYPDQVQTATWQLEFFITAPEPGNVFTIWVVPDRDLDTDDDGVLDHSITILDSVSLPDGDLGDLAYSETILHPDLDIAASAVRAASRRVDGNDTNSETDWSRADLDGDVLPFEVAQTPGFPNNPAGVGLEDGLPGRENCAPGNYPNPLEKTTRISFCPPPGIASATITVFDLLGRVQLEVESVMARETEAEMTIDTEDLPSGVYFYLVRAGDHVETGPMVVVK